MEIIYHGHSCVQVKTEAYNLIIDPFITGNPQARIKAEELKVDYILLSHGHNDHVGDTISLAKANDATVIAPFELAEYLGWQGCKVHGLHIGGGYNFPFGRAKLTPAFHGSALTFDDKQEIIYMGMPAGILLTINDKTLYHAGDTGLFGDMKLIGERNTIDVALLPIGDNYTMGPEDALTAAEWLKAGLVIPIHFNTFPVIQQDGEKFIHDLNARGIQGKILESGEAMQL